MLVPCHRRNVAATVASASLLVAALLVYHRHQFLVRRDVCPRPDDRSSSSQKQLRDAEIEESDVSRQRLRRRSTWGVDMPARQHFPADEAPYSRTGRKTVAESFQGSSERYEFQRRNVAQLSDDDLPTVAAATRINSTGLNTAVTLPPPVQRQFVLHRCPASFNIQDPQDEWFRKAVVQRSPPMSQVTFTDEILILTPICNSETLLRHYFENLCSLAYPHRLISVVLGEDSSNDKTLQMAEELVVDFAPFFRRLELVRLPGRSAHRTGKDRHHPAFQLHRRQHIALARNRLLSAALGLLGAQAATVNWVLWMDVDVRHIPRDLIRHLLAANRTIVVPNCLWRMNNGQTTTFDRNTWRETNESLAELNSLLPEELMLEGYRTTKRRFLNDLKTESDLVRLDGVGGCVLLIAADLHRSGLMFPPFVFEHHIETEGLAKMAARMGVQIYGLPSVNVIHW